MLDTWRWITVVPPTSHLGCCTVCLRHDSRVTFVCCWDVCVALLWFRRLPNWLLYCLPASRLPVDVGLMLRGVRCLTVVTPTPHLGRCAVCPRLECRSILHKRLGMIRRIWWWVYLGFIIKRHEWRNAMLTWRIGGHKHRRYNIWVVPEIHINFW